MLVFPAHSSEGRLRVALCSRKRAPVGFRLTIPHERSRPPPTLLIDDMNENFQKLLAQMDEKLWLRMLVCFLPGLVVGKLAGQFPGAFLGVTGTLLLVIGVAIFTMWARLRKLGSAEDDEVVEPEGDVVQMTPGAQVAAAESRSGADTAKSMNELLKLFGGDGELMVNAIETESLVNPALTYGEAVELALRRKRLQGGTL
jgi:hypothetical protein